MYQHILKNGRCKAHTRQRPQVKQSNNFESKILLNTENFPPIIMVIANVPKFPDKNNIYPKFFLTNCTPPKYNPIPYSKFPNFPNFF